MFPCAFSPWTPGIGDSHVFGWAIVGIYLAAAVACAIVGRRGGFPNQTQGRELLFWWLCAALLALLAVNKQLDLQSLLTAVARCVALDQGWYEDRRDVQRKFVLAVLAGGLLLVIVSGLWLRKTFARTGLAILGLGLVSTFVVIRAASFHHVDSLINETLLGLRMNWLLELPGPILILVAAVRTGRFRAPV